MQGTRFMCNVNLHIRRTFARRTVRASIPCICLCHLACDCTLAPPPTRSCTACASCRRRGECM
mgnify:CR=1 FL=1